MPSIEVIIDTETGETTTEINGVQGPACEKIAEAIKEHFGQPAEEKNKPEYHIRTQVKPKARH